MSSSLITLLARHRDHDAGTTLDVGRVVDLADILDVLPDPRRRQGRRYRLGSLLALCTIAVLAGATTLVAIARHATYLPKEIRDRLGLRAAPRATTLGRVLGGVLKVPHCTSPGESDDLCAVAVDGETLRGSRTVTRRAANFILHVPEQLRGNRDPHDHYASQDEWAFFRRIPPQAITGVHIYEMTGRAAGTTLMPQSIRFRHDRWVANPNYHPQFRYNPTSDPGAHFSFDTP
ncbi:transposase family protein [Streptomyces muensis]|uniref:Transposase family protein n=1 Tax=Streptomyces muensis TaxID=1077944 RepID=A0A9X1PU23_STRM4|nr:transposase family protein [Streptomyces muensis]MCF1592549.1 transposase family protein [Streptomyces muensis]